MPSTAPESWKIEFYSTPNGNEPVRVFIDGLSGQAQASVLRDLQLLREFGLAVGFPTVRPLEGIRKLWELRVKTKDGAVRIFYAPRTGRRFILLHGFIKKSAKTPQTELKVAIKRLNQVLSERE